MAKNEDQDRPDPEHPASGDEDVVPTPHNFALRELPV
jgi:hypothetical protein